MRDKSGINEYEDPDEPMPKGYVQVMTIHQAKGLQFPVVVVGSLAVRLSSPKDVDRVLGPFYHRSPFEPANRITGFDRMRLHYVAFIGKVDLLLGGDGKLELLDFKSQPPPEENDDRIPSYYQQLCTYSHILETRDGECPERLMLYWTGEPKREDALMIFPYEPHIVDQAGAHFDEVVKCILDSKFAIKTLPDRKVCKECDLRVYCINEKVFLKSSDSEE